MRKEYYIPTIEVVVLEAELPLANSLAGSKITVPGKTAPMPREKAF